MTSLCAADDPIPLQGSPEVMAEALRGYAREGIGHVQLVLDPITTGSLEAFARVLELLDRPAVSAGVSGG